MDKRPAPAGLRYLRGPANVEDLVQVPDSDWLIGGGISTDDPGALYAINSRTKAWTAVFDRSHGAIGRAGPGASGAPDRHKLSIHGLSIQPAGNRESTLYAVNHGGREAIEIFKLTGHPETGEPAARWEGCRLLPPRSWPNAVTVAPDGSLYVTSMFDPTDPESWKKMASGETTGAVLVWRPGAAAFTELPGSRMPGANGIEVSADNRWLYVAAWAAGQVRRLNAGDGHTAASLQLPFLPDNLRWSRDRKTLLVGGQNTTVAEINAHPESHRPANWSVARIDPAALSAAPLVTDAEGTAEFSDVATALETPFGLFLSGRGDHRIAFRPDILPAP